MSIRLFLAALLCSWLTGAAQAQSYPAKPILAIYPYAPGGGMDSLIRPWAQRLSASLGTPVTVDFKPGANSIIGTDYVAKAAPDGYTFLFSAASIVLNPFLYSKLPYDLTRDLAPVAGLVRTAFGIGARPTLPGNNIKSVIDLARAKAGQVTYGTSGIGSGPHLVMEMLQSAAGITLTHVPYKGSNPAIIDVNAGRIDMAVLSAGSLVTFAKAGKIKVIAVTTQKRSPAFPDVETVAESAGLPDFDASGWWGMHAPAGVPRSILERINGETRQILTEPSFRAKFVDPRGEEPMSMTLPQFEAFHQAELAKWGKVIRDAKIKLE